MSTTVHILVAILMIFGRCSIRTSSDTNVTLVNIPWFGDIFHQPLLPFWYLLKAGFGVELKPPADNMQGYLTLRLDPLSQESKG